MSKHAILRDEAGNSIGHLDLDSGRVYDDGGKQTGYMPPTGHDVRALSDYAASLYHANIAAQTGRPVTMRDGRGGERLVTMDLGQADVHVPAALPNYAAGYRLADGVADLAAPPVLVAKASDKYNTWDKENAFQRVQVAASSSGASVQEVNPALSRDTYSTVEYALGSFVPTNVQSNADAPLNPLKAAVRRVMNAIYLEREIRVASLLTTAGNWDSALVQTLNSGTKWNGGASSDPIKDLQTAIQNSYMPVTGIILPEPVLFAFQRNPNVQKYFAYKDSSAPLPSASQLSAILQLPPIHVAKMKYLASGSLSYVWGGDAVLLHSPAANPPADQEDVATAYTFRWNGGETNDGVMTAGFLVRTYFDNRRGGRGGTMTVVVHNDDEAITSKYVGGLIKGCVQ